MTLTAAISGEQRGLEAKGQVCNTLKNLGGNKRHRCKRGFSFSIFCFLLPSHYVSEYLKKSE